MGKKTLHDCFWVFPRVAVVKTRSDKTRLIFSSLHPLPYLPLFLLSPSPFSSPSHYPTSSPSPSRINYTNLDIEYLEVNFISLLITEKLNKFKTLFSFVILFKHLKVKLFNSEIHIILTKSTKVQI